MGIFEEAFSQNANMMTTSGLSSFGYVLKPTAGKIYAFTALNSAGSYRAVKIYNTSATVDPLTYTPVWRTIIAASSMAYFNSNVPMNFSDGISIVATSTLNDASGGTPTAGTVMFNCLWA
jgi:hypothetical protein